MQQESLLEAQAVTFAHAQTKLAAVDREPLPRAFAQGTALPDSAIHSNQCQPCYSSQAVHEACSARDSTSVSTSHPHREEVEMNTSPSTPRDRGVPAPSTRPPDAPCKSRQARAPIQLSPNAPVRKLDFDSSFLHTRASNDSEQSCSSRHRGPGQG
ncbi:hypothetical protein ABBQ32_011879 [Trebouxia sp. C0010 RCD-2024]